jgi:cupredoxin-like protein
MKGKIPTRADRMLTRTMIASVFVAAVAAVGSPAVAHATQSAGLKTTTITVSTHNSRYVLSAKVAPRGVVIFKIANPALEPHDFSIKGRTSKLLTTGQSTTLRVTFLRKGRYSYKDTFDHHAQFGCRGGFKIT